MDMQVDETVPATPLPPTILGSGLQKVAKSSTIEDKTEVQMKVQKILSKKTNTAKRYKMLKAKRKRLLKKAARIKKLMDRIQSDLDLF